MAEEIRKVHGIICAEVFTRFDCSGGVGMDAEGLMEDAQNWIACSKFMRSYLGMRYLFWVKKKEATTHERRWWPLAYSYFACLL